VYVELPVIHVSMVVAGQTKLFQLVLKEPVSYEDEIQ
jgi:hypothetical protein